MKNDDRWVIQKQVRSQSFAPVYVGIEYHQKLKDLAKETHVPMRSILEQMVVFCLDHIEIKEDPHEND